MRSLPKLQVQVRRTSLSCCIPFLKKKRKTKATAIDKELANYESKLKEVDLNKTRLEREIDNLPIDARFRERKIHDMTLRLDALYDTIVELEERIEDAKLRKSSIEMETITLDNIANLKK